MKEEALKKITGTPEGFWAGLEELNVKFAETERLFKESCKEYDKLFKENEKLMKQNWKQIKETSRNIGGVSNSNGEVAEAYFINSFSNNNLQFAGQEYDSYDPKLKKMSKKLDLQGEFDLVMYNCESVAIIEIKYKARKRDVETLLLKPQTFRQLFPQYENFQFYLGLAGLTMDEDAELEAKEQGIAVIKQVGANMVINDAYLKVF